MGSALRRVDIIYETIRILTVGIVVLHGDLHRHAVLHSLAVNDLVIERCLALVQISHEFFDTAFVMECVLAKGLFTPVS